MHDTMASRRLMDKRRANLQHERGLPMHLITTTLATHTTGFTRTTAALLQMPATKPTV